MELLNELEQLVSEAETRAAREKIEASLRTALDAWNAAVREAQDAKEAFSQLESSVETDVQRLDLEQQRLTDLENRMATVRSYLADTSLAEQLVENARTAISQERREVQSRIDEAEERVRVATTALQQASHAYRRSREDADTAGVGTKLEGAPGMREVMRVLPQGELLELEQEVADVQNWFDTFSAEEQLARLKVWIGRLRRLQEEITDPEAESRSRKVFTALVGISKTHQPGYVDAFRTDYVTDWNAYIIAAERQFTEAQAREAETRAAREREAARGEERRQKLVDARDTLVSFLGGGQSPEEIAEDLRKLVATMPSEAYADREILRLLHPYENLFADGSEFRAVRRNLQKMSEPEKRELQIEESILEVTRGRRGVLVGGEAREPARLSVQSALEFASLDWAAGSEQDALRVEPRVRNRSVDMVLLLRNFISHSAADRLVDACKSAGIEWRWSIRDMA